MSLLGTVHESDGRTWFTEVELPHGRRGLKINIEVAEVLVDERSEWGLLQVFDTPFFGRLLAIDGIVQVTESDEFIYHELMVTLPGVQHGAPSSVLITGGGDGGALRQALRFGGLASVTQVEIDEAVSRVCRRYLPSVSSGAFEDPRTRLVWQDAYAFVAETDQRFDVIVLDLTDPVEGSPAERLFDADFLKLVAGRLTPDGIVMTQCGSLIFQPDEVRQQVERLSRVFPHVRLHQAVVPSYQLTSFGFVMASAAELDRLDRAEFEARLGGVTGESGYLDYDSYRASMTLPPYLRRQLLGPA
ncbi:polyamine aminopropyltransferase [Microlunatus speluncae]|uniref:polyamine aminopropyltransferase n=1 Tax=Microlunatus speluncae TaxID=2594267 RepID=UPI0013761A6F|nr:polyamine aminopropyltransferase [Microlunatus speluncae]